MGIQIQTQGRRHYLVGDTYQIREQLQAAGCHFDRETPPTAAPRGAWWTSKLEVAQRFAGAAAPQASAAVDAPQSGGRNESLGGDSTVIGRASYKGREYLLVWEGTTSRGPAAKLAFTDGSKVFWADAAAVHVTKRYHAREYRGQRQPMTFGRLQRLREEYAEQRQADREQTLVGEKGHPDLVSSVEVDKGGTPGGLGEAVWLRHRAVRLAVVITGYKTPVYIRESDAEDMGHFGVSSGWYSTTYYRPATPGEYEALQARDPRADGTCAAVGEAVVAALAGAAGEAST